MTARGQVRSGTEIGNTLFGLLKTLKGFVFTATAGVAFFVFIGATFASSLLYEHLLEARNLEISREIARQSVRAILEVLQRGGARGQVDAVIAGSKAAFPTTVEQITLYRGRKAEALYGATHVPPFPEEVQRALGHGDEVVINTGRQLQYLYPLIAQPDRLRCRANAAGGDVLGFAEREMVRNITLLEKFVVDVNPKGEILGAVRGLGIDYAQGYHISRPSPMFRRSGAKRRDAETELSGVA